MNKLTREDLYSLEQYSSVRGEFREKVIAHKRDRRIELGTNASLYFEDRLTMQYQIQEMLRIERIFETTDLAPLVVVARVHLATLLELVQRVLGARRLQEGIQRRIEGAFLDRRFRVLVVSGHLLPPQA